MNYIPIRIHNPIICKFVYADIDKDFMADQIFVNHKLRVKFKGEFHKAGEKYVMICITIKKKDKDTFIKCMEELKNKAALLGHTDYQEFCDYFHDMLHSE